MTPAEVVPSVSWIAAVRTDSVRHLVCEGNGRITAIQAVFLPEDGVRVEIEEQVLRIPVAIIRLLDRVRLMNGLLEDRAYTEWER